MRFSLLPRWLNRSFLGLLVCGLLMAAPLAARAQTGAAPANAPLTNASPDELRALAAIFSDLEHRLEVGDAEALGFFGVGKNAVPGTTVKTRITHIAVAPGGALAHQLFWIGAPNADGRQQILSSGARDLWLARTANGFSFTQKTWARPDDAANALAIAASEEWKAVAQNGNEAATDADGAASGKLLHLVASWRGGRWIALRRSRWDGAILDTAALQARQRRNVAANAGDVTSWLRLQMARYTSNRVGVTHFIFQDGAGGWVGLDSVWEPLTTATRSNARDEEAVADARRALEDGGYLTAGGHRALGLALSQIGLFGEAGDELEKAETLQPGIIGAAMLAQADGRRTRDPQVLAMMQMQSEARVGLGAEHPRFVIRELARRDDQQPSPLTALRLGLEYSKLADDRRAAAWMQAAQQMIKRGQPVGSNPNEVAWARVLYDHLQERSRLAPLKPPNIVRSALFTVRCWPNDLNTLPMLAALESAQHTVYADFGIPMGSTEVVLWRAQGEFQKYTSRFSDEPTSEFVAALTLTKLIATQSGPLVLGEEVNAFIDPRADLFGTVSHEYGHVAVRQLSRGRLVPVWFNEGVASAVEGGYDGYLPRVKAADDAGTLLPMRELQDWNVDGERAFLAYSQANSIIDYVVARWGKNAVLEILRQIGRDVPPETAMRSILGLSSQGLWKEWAREGIK